MLGGVIFGLLNWKNSKEIRDQVNARFGDQVDKIVADKITKFDGDLNSYRVKLEDAFRQLTELKTAKEEITGQLAGLTERCADMAYILAYSFSALENDPNDPGWQNARRDCIVQLNELRCDLPHWRRVGILLGRLHKSFDDHESAVKVLTEVIDARNQRRLPPDEDHAALLFNRACYRNMQADIVDKAQSDKLKKEAWEDLKHAILLNPNDLQEASDDSDLETLWNENERRKDNLGKINKPFAPRASTGFLSRLSRLLFGAEKTQK
ncbi:hypothetical protein GCM10023212_34290 [Luteolibacter yonseiensis]